jgi:hypothetical protein
MNNDLEHILDRQGGVATSGQVLDCITRYAFDRMLDDGSLERLWQGVYCRGAATDVMPLRGVDLSCGRTVPRVYPPRRRCMTSTPRVTPRST